MNIFMHCTNEPLIVCGALWTLQILLVAAVGLSAYTVVSEIIRLFK